MTRILSEPVAEDLRATSTISQKLAEGARRASEMQKGLLTLPDCSKGFESVFTKKDFDILLEHRQWDHAIKLIRPYLYQFFNNSHSLNGYGKPLKRPFD